MLSPQKKPDIDSALLKRRKGLLIVYTGDGKGKTTAALGVALRALGNELKVCMIQFIKGKWLSGEHRATKEFANRFEILPMGEGFTWDTKNRSRDQEMVMKAWKVCQEKMMSKKYDVCIFDEINYVIDYEYLNVKDVIEALRQKPAEVHVILTGRNAKPELIETADLVTEMKEIKHPFTTEKLSAQLGIDF